MYIYWTLCGTPRWDPNRRKGFAAISRCSRFCGWKIISERCSKDCWGQRERGCLFIHKKMILTFNLDVYSLGWQWFYEHFPSIAYKLQIWLVGQKQVLVARPMSWHIHLFVGTSNKKTIVYLLVCSLRRWSFPSRIRVLRPWNHSN